MKRTAISIAIAAALSLPAYANDEAREQSSQTDQSQQGGQNPALVKQAQEKLSASGKDVGTPDGRMGPKTQAALKEFQQEKGLEQTGQLDQQTVAALELEESGSASSGGTSSGQSESNTE